MSTETVPPTKWRLAVGTLFFTLAAGGTLILALALGLADPPRAVPLAWQADSAADWPVDQTLGEFELYRAPIPLPLPPFTLELSANNGGQGGSAWGIWLQTTGGIQTMMVNNEGYLSVSADAAAHWAEFIHIRSETNKLYFDLAGDGRATLRINDEIAWRAILAAADDSNWGVAFHRNPQVTWEFIRVYMP